MPLKNGKMTPPEKAFTKVYAATGDATYSAQKAGYSSPQPRSSEMLQKPAIQAEILRLQTERLFNEILPLAIQAHVEILTDPKTPAGARTQAVKLAYDRTFGASDAANGKEPHEMTPAELARALAEAKLKAAALESVKADRARPIVDVEPIDDSEDEGILG